LHNEDIYVINGFLSPQFHVLVSLIIYDAGHTTCLL